MLVVIPESRELRAAIKQWGDVEQGVVTQIVRASKLHGARNQYCNNLALKINIKLGGANSTTTPQSLQRILKLGTMVCYCFCRSIHVLPYPKVVGVDTSHPPPGVKSLPTVSGFVQRSTFRLLIVSLTLPIIGFFNRCQGNTVQSNYECSAGTSRDHPRCRPES